MNPIDGFNSPVELAVSTLPSLVDGRFAPPFTTSTSTLTLSAGVMTPTTSGAPFTVTGTSGPTAHTLSSMGVAVSAGSSTCGYGTPVKLTSAFNLTALRSDGAAFIDGGLDGVGWAYSATTLGRARVLYGMRYKIGTPDLPNAVYAAGQTIALPKGRFGTLGLLGTGIGGNQSGQVLTVTYTDGSTAQFKQGFSDVYAKLQRLVVSGRLCQ